MSDEIITNEIEQKVIETDTQGAADGREGEDKTGRKAKVFFRKKNVSFQ